MPHDPDGLLDVYITFYSRMSLYICVFVCVGEWQGCGETNHATTVTYWSNYCNSKYICEIM